jgi:hypothetical protein
LSRSRLICLLTAKRIGFERYRLRLNDKFCKSFY